MSKIFEIIKKNFRLLVRSKTSSLIIFIGPLLLVSLLGLAYSQSSTFTLTAAVYSEQYTSLSESLITKMATQNFKVLKQKTLQDCVNSLKKGESQACIEFPKAMKIEQGKKNELTFYVDYSRINLVWMIVDVMTTKVSEESGEISKQLTTDLLERMGFVETKIGQAQQGLNAIKTDEGTVKKKVSSIKKSVETLGIEINFSGIDFPEIKIANLEIIALFDKIKTNITELQNATDVLLSNISSAAGTIESIANSSAVYANINKIKSDISDIKNKLNNTLIIINSTSLTATQKIEALNTSLTAIDTKITSAQSKITEIKKSRDGLLPIFDNINTDVDNLITKIDSAYSTLDEAIQKIQALKTTNAAQISSPITTKVQPVATQKSHFSALFPTLVALIIMITGILLASTLVITEKKSKAFFRNNLTPISYFSFSLATYLTALLVLIIQLVIFVSISTIFFKVGILKTAWLVMLLLFLISSVFIFIGMIIGYLFRTEESVTLASITIASILLLFSSAVLPLESLPLLVKKFALLNPFVISELALKQIVVFQFGVTKIMMSLLFLVGYALALFFLLIILQDVFKKLAFIHFSELKVPKIKSDGKNKVEKAVQKTEIQNKDPIIPEPKDPY